MSGTPTLSVLIPWRDWPKERTEQCVSRFVCQRDPPAQINIGCLGMPSVPIREGWLGTPEGFPCVMQAILGPPDGPWNRALALNVAARAATSTHLLAIDADTLPATSRILGDFLAELGTAPDALWLAECWDVRWRDEPGWEIVGPHGRQGMGGFCCVPRPWLESVRGWDEQYTHWGGEDTDLVARAQASGLEIRWWERASQEPLIWTWKNDATCPDPLATGEGLAAKAANVARVKAGATLPIVRNPKTWGGQP